MTAAPGSLPWLVRHELRLYLRSAVWKSSSLTALILAQILLHLVAVGAAFAVRADLDLLLSSPLPPFSIFGVRLATVALTVTLEVAFLVWPFANVFLLFGLFSWSKLYLLLPAFGMLTTAVGVVLALALFRLLGPRTTRVFGQVFAALIGLVIFLSSQLPNLLQSGSRAQSRHQNGFQSLLHADAGRLGAALVPARLVLAGFGPTMVFALISAGLLLVTVHVSSERFLRAATIIGSMGATRGAALSVAPLRFRRSLHAVMILKELRLIRRDPLLVTQLLQQSIYVLPTGAFLWRYSVRDSGQLPWAWLVLIFLSGTLASALAWITIAAEDAPELMATAPRTRATLVRVKIEAALAPLTLLWIAPLVMLARSHPWFALWVAACAFGSSLSTAVLQVRRPAAKRDSLRSRDQGAPGRGLLEVGVMLSWMLLCGLLAWVGTRLSG